MRDETTLTTSTLARVDSPTPDRHIPSATYRLQFNRTFTFRDAAETVPYLRDLGISDCYASPYLRASPGSTHGYDVIDHGALNPEVGSDEDYHAFVEALRGHGMCHLLDVVPNHMGVTGGENPWWADVLENGPSSPFAAFFDIDWLPVKPELADKVLLPILGDQYGRALENQDLQLCYGAGAFWLSVYGGARLPIAPRPSIMLLTHGLGELEHALGADHPALVELQSIVTALSHLPLRTETEPEKIRERQREKEVIKRRLAAAADQCPEVRTFIERNVVRFNGTKGDPRSFDLLDALLADQAYRLAYWRVAAEEINYRRFFDVNQLAALRAEDPAVFVATHALVLRLLAEHKICGVRIDHIDGLYDPAAYLRRLRRACAAAHAGADPAQSDALLAGNGHADEGEPTAAAQGRAPERPYYVVVEKILGPHEHLPDTWPVDGTSGYDFLATLNGLFVDARNEKACTEIYERFTGAKVRFAELVYDSKKLIMQVALSSELNVLAHQLHRLAQRDRHSRDFTLNSLTNALREVVACFPVYRTYIEYGGVTDTDRATVQAAVAHARRRNPATDASVFAFIRDVLLLQLPGLSGDADRSAYVAFAMKFQQYTGPVMAKGVEDTAFYRYHRLVSLNEVGGTPEQFGAPPALFHERNRQRLERWPHALLATTTHDTKRSEDVRARIHVLSEIPRQWRAAVGRWRKRNAKKKREIDGAPAPDRNDEYLFYQTLVGVWPATPPQGDDLRGLTERLQEYMRKATKEAKVNTSWISPNEAYDEAVQQFVAAALGDAAFLREVAPLAERVARHGACNALAQTVLKLTVPGVPDVYQGNELWDFSLVDPDNRRPVDYAHRREALRALRGAVAAAGGDPAGLARELVRSWEDGRIKLYVTYRTLTFRREHPELFRRGAYVPLAAGGEAEPHVCAFARRHGHHDLIVAVPRLTVSLPPQPDVWPLGGGAWKGATLPLPAGLGGRRYRNVFTGEVLSAAQPDGHAALALGDVFAQFPVAVLVGEGVKNEK